MTTELSLHLFLQVMALESVWLFTYLAFAVHFSELHSEVTRVGGVQLQIYTGCHGAYCPAATFIYFLETPVGLEYW